MGLVWQVAFAVAFCGRYPSFAESTIIGLTIWIAYTADRLLDSMHLDLSRPHTLRHRFHFHRRRQIGLIWISAIVVDAILVFNSASESQLRWGYAAIAAVLAYGGGVHFVGHARCWIPKELQAGVVFAVGVSLMAWSETNRDLAPLLCSTLMAGLLFSANCFAVACWERNLDASQGFASWLTRYPTASKWLPTALITHLASTGLLFGFQLLPGIIAACLAVGNVSLLAAVMFNRVHIFRVTPTSEASATGVFGVFADAALVILPVACITAGVTF